MAPNWQGAVTLEQPKGNLSDVDIEKIAAEVGKAINPSIMRAMSGPANPQVQAMGNGGVGGPGMGGIMPTPNPSSPYQQGGIELSSPLPREYGAFESQFGPGFPYWPQALDVPPPGAMRPEPRRSQYEVAWNLLLLDREVPWSMLRQLATQTDIISRSIDIAIDTICGLDFDFTVSNSAIRAAQAEDPSLSYSQASRVVQQQYMPEIDKARAFWETPDRDMGQSFADWLTGFLWDYFVYDGVAVYPQLNLDGSLRNLSLVDAASIKLYRDDYGRKPRFPNPAYGQVLWGFIRGEFQHTSGEADDEYYDSEAELPPEFRRDQLAYYIRRTRQWSVYGMSPTEECIPMAVTYLARQEWLREEYQSGAQPKMFMKIGSAESAAWTPQQFAAYQQILNSKLSGLTANRARIQVIRGDFEPVPMPQMDEHYKVDYDAHLITQIGSKFGVNGTQLGIAPKAGLGGGKQMQGEQQQAETVSQKPLTEWLVDKINDLNRRFLGISQVITATFGEGGTDEDELNNAKRDQVLVSTGQKTLNDIRGENGDPLYDIPEADQPMIVTATGPVFVSGTFAAAQAAANEPTPTGGAEDAGTAGGQAGDDPGDGGGDSAGQSGPATDATPTEPVRNGKTPAKGTTGDPGHEDDTDTSVSAPKTGGNTGKSAELQTFVRFVAKRAGKDWRPFAFEHQDDERVSRLLNYLGEQGEIDEIKALLADGGDVSPKELASSSPST